MRVLSSQFSYFFFGSSRFSHSRIETREKVTVLHSGWGSVSC